MNVSESTALKVVIYGGNGFVGTHVAKELAGRHLAGRHIETVCLSRTGHKPLHLIEESWSENVRWCKGDASKPDLELLKTTTSLICLVGSPPLPTFSRESYEQQYFMNGVTNGNAIDAAADAGVKRLVLLSAQIPRVMRTDKFAYFKGKQYAQTRAKAFAERSDAHSAVIIEPGVVTGRRHLENGKSIPLNKIMWPGLKLLPSQFVTVERLAECIVREAIETSPTEQLTTIRNRDI